jgi:hypothetical protein
VHLERGLPPLVCQTGRQPIKHYQALMIKHNFKDKNEIRLLPRFPGCSCAFEFERMPLLP